MKPSKTSKAMKPTAKVIKQPKTKDGKMTLKVNNSKYNPKKMDKKSIASPRKLKVKMGYSN